jgi:peptidoglycan hydrolase-like protein with peptidoglycan-binding domain
MTRVHLPVHLPTVLLSLGFALCGMQAARSDELRVGLVIANEDYESLPALPRCAASAKIVGDALRGKGFKLVERGNLERGEFDSAIASLIRRIAASPPAAAIVYYCGYAQAFDGHSFLLPTSAASSDDRDAPGQGIALLRLADNLDGSSPSSGLIVLDVFRRPNSTAPTALGRLVEEMNASFFSIVGASNDGTGKGPTATSLALRDQLAENDVKSDMTLLGMRRQLSPDAAVEAQYVPAIGIPASARARQSTSAGAAASAVATTIPAQQRPAPAAPVPSNDAPAQPSAPAASAVSAREPPAKASLPAPTPPHRVIAERPTLSAEHKRLIQWVLADMGYYSGQIDGKFGRETRAAIRRYQFGIKDEVTGRLTADQATTLLCVMLCPPVVVPRDDAAYCAKLTTLYRRYLDNTGDGRSFPDATASVAVDDCAKGNAAAGIPVLEKKLRDGGFFPTPQG